MSEDYTSGGALFIACGVLLVGVSVVGCIGAYFKWRPLLLAVSEYFTPSRYHVQCRPQYLAVIFLVIALEIAAIGYAFAKADDLVSKTAYSISRGIPVNLIMRDHV